VGDHHRCGAAVQQVPQQRDAGPDPAVVTDPAVLHRDVQVAPDQDALAPDVELGGLLH
jgi:hypothetical protein